MANYITAGNAALERAKEYAKKHGGRIYFAEDVFQRLADDCTESYGPGFVVSKRKPRGELARCKDFLAEGPFELVE